MPDSKILILEVAASARADVLILQAMHHEAALALVSRARLKEAFHEDRVLLGGRAIEPADILEPGRHEITLLEWRSLVDSFAQPSPRGAFLPVVHEDESLLVLDKLPGTPSVPHSANEVDTAVGAALAHLIAQGKTLEDIRTINPEKPLESGLLHRLDTGTSGLLAFAKSHEAYVEFSRAWKERQVRKIYRAIVESETNPLPGGYPGTVRIELAHDARSSRRMIALTDEISQKKDLLKKRARGKPLPTVTHLLEAHELAHSGGGIGANSDAAGGSRRLWDVTIEIETGVMHQIRCVLAALGAPILGDPTYKSKNKADKAAQISHRRSGSTNSGTPLQYSAASRLWLHAWRLEIPVSGGRKAGFEAPLPEGWPKSSK